MVFGGVYGFVLGAFINYQAGRYQQRKAERDARDKYNNSLQDRLVMSVASTAWASRRASTTSSAWCGAGRSERSRS
jgi:hypothetical protein